MKKYLFLAIICFVSMTSCYAESSLAKFPMMKETIDNQEDVLQHFDPKLIAKYQEVAGVAKPEGISKLMGAVENNCNIREYVSKGFPYSVDTYTISYEVIRGVLYHVGWYIDGCVITSLDGPQAGKQVVFRNGIAVAITYVADYYDGFFAHYYPGGIIYSYANYQLFVPY